MSTRGEDEVLLTRKIQPRTIGPLAPRRNPSPVLLRQSSAMLIRLKQSRKSPSHWNLGTLYLNGRTTGHMYVALGVENTTAARTPDPLSSNVGKRYLVGSTVTALMTA